MPPFYIKIKPAEKAQIHGKKRFLVIAANEGLEDTVHSV